MVESRHEPISVERKRLRRKAGERLPPLGLKPLDPAKHLLKARPRKTGNEWVPGVSSDLRTDLQITQAELDAIVQLLGDDLKAILG
jgi:hypothetical protein